jgi:hypothetical protein
MFERPSFEHLQAHLPDTILRYWRDKSGHEVDFIVARRRDEVDAIECKWNPAGFDFAGLKAFRTLYPKGRNYLVCPSASPPFLKQSGPLQVQVCEPSGLVS